MWDWIEPRCEGEDAMCWKDDGCKVTCNVSMLSGLFDASL